MSDSESKPHKKVILTAGIAFTSFERAVRSDARRNDVWDLIEGNTSDFRKDIEKTRAANQKALGIIEDHLDDENASLISSCTNAAQAFALLKKHHVGMDSGGQFMAIHHLMTLKLEAEDDRTSIISKSNSAMQRVKALVSPQIAVKVEGDGSETAIAKKFDQFLDQLQISAILNALLQDERTSASATSLLIQKDLSIASVHSALRTMDSVAKLSNESALKSNTRFKPKSSPSTHSVSNSTEKKYCTLHESNSHALVDCKVVQNLIKEYKAKRKSSKGKEKANQAIADSDSEEEIEQANFTFAALKTT